MLHNHSITFPKEQMWLPNVKYLWLTVKLLKAYVKEQIWLTNVKYFRVLTLHGHYIHLCTISKVIGINVENKMSAKQGIYVFIDDNE